MSGIIEKLVEKGVMVVSAQDSYLFMLIVFLWLCWKVREMRVRPKYLAERGIIKLIAKDIACEKEKKQVLRNARRYKELLSSQYKVKMRNLMQDEQFLRLAVVRYLMSTEHTRDSIFDQYAAEIKGWSFEKPEKAIWKTYGGYYLFACVMVAVIIAGDVSLGVSENPFKVLALDEMVIYVVLCLLYAGVLAIFGSLLCKGMEFLETHEGDQYFC